MFPCIYQFEVKGKITRKWIPWFEFLKLTEIPNGNTLLEGEIFDENTLYGVISRLRDLGLILVRMESVHKN